MISVREIRKTYPNGWTKGIRAVDGVSFELTGGEVVGLLGPNGAGKSTTIRMITGFLAADSGSITVAGVNAIRRPVRARRSIGYLPEHAPLYLEMTPLSYLRYRARLCGLSGGKAKKRALAVADRCALTHMLGRRIGNLSKGYRQRVGLAAALVHDPKVLILDEPASGLDPAQIREMRTLVRELAQNKTMLLSSHILDEVERTCDRVVIIAGGAVRADDTPAEIMRRHGPNPAVEFECKGDPAAIDPRAVSQAAGGGWNRGRVEPLDGEDARGLAEQIGRSAAMKQIQLRELGVKTGSLEDAFMLLTREGRQEQGLAIREAAS